MSKTVNAIVRGPRPHFRDGVLYAPGQIVQGVPAEEVSEKPFRKVEVEYEARNGDMRTKTIEKPVKFRPVGDAAVITESLSTAEVVTGQPDRLNVSDFLKQSADDIAAAIESGSVDAHLGAIEQAELSRKGPARKAVKAALSARLAATA